MLYATGEIALVVIGILNALQINKWNERSKNKAVEGDFHSELIIDLERDSIKLESLSFFYKNRLNQLDWILKEIRKPRADPDIIEFGRRIEPLHYVLDGVSYSSTFETAKCSGDFTRFRDKMIIKELNQYYADYKKIEEILSSSLRLVDFRLEPLLSTIPANHLNLESGRYVIAMEDNFECYK